MPGLTHPLPLPGGDSYSEISTVLPDLELGFPFAAEYFPSAAQ